MIHLIPIDEAHIQSEACWCNPELVPAENLEGRFTEKEYLMAVGLRQVYKRGLINVGATSSKMTLLPWIVLIAFLSLLLNIFLVSEF